MSSAPFEEPQRRPRMHADEIDIDMPLVRRLVVAQFPQWADLPIEPVLPQGTDNAMYRLGSDLAVRLPRLQRTEQVLEKEVRWLPRLAPLLPVAVPVPVVAGEPAEDYSLKWAVYTWLPGENPSATAIPHPVLFAGDLARFMAALQGIDPTWGPAPGDHNFFRGEPLANRDVATRAAIASLADTIDTEAVTSLWEEALRAPQWQGPPVWIHGDLDARNLLVQNGRLSGVIDFGCLGVGDPACEIMVAWKLLPVESRERFRAALSVDDATWQRARGWALSQAVGALSYYTLETNPTLVFEAERWMAEVLPPWRLTS